MKVLIFKTAEDAVDRTAKQIIEQVRTKPESVLGLATGGTMPPVYDRMMQACQNRQVSFSRACSFNLDEYIGLSKDHPCSYHRFMDEALFGGSDFDKHRVHLPFGDAEDPDEEALRYDALITSTGPIDLQLLGLGQNGHIGFNEPTSSLGSRTRVKTLTQNTRNANMRFFSEGEQPPKLAITVGVQTILESLKIILLATGPDKAAAVAAMIEGPIGAFCPASALQMHRNTTVVLDTAAAAKLKLRSYYSLVHPDGQEIPNV